MSFAGAGRRLTTRSGLVWRQSGQHDRCQFPGGPGRHDRTIGARAIVNMTMPLPGPVAVAGIDAPHGRDGVATRTVRRRLVSGWRIKDMSRGRRPLTGSPSKPCLIPVVPRMESSMARPQRGPVLADPHDRLSGIAPGVATRLLVQVTPSLARLCRACGPSVASSACVLSAKIAPARLAARAVTITSRILGILGGIIFPDGILREGVGHSGLVASTGPDRMYARSIVQVALRATRSMCGISV
jgi:hypothetical protein